MGPSVIVHTERGLGERNRIVNQTDSLASGGKGRLRVVFGAMILLLGAALVGVTSSMGPVFSLEYSLRSLETELSYGGGAYGLSEAQRAVGSAQLDLDWAMAFQSQDSDGELRIAREKLARAERELEQARQKADADKQVKRDRLELGKSQQRRVEAIWFAVLSVLGAGLLVSGVLAARR